MDKQKRQEIFRLIEVARQKGMTIRQIHPKANGSAVSRILRDPEKVLTAKKKTLLEIEENIEGTLGYLDKKIDKELSKERNIRDGSVLSKSLSKKLSKLDKKLDNDLDKNSDRIFIRIEKLETENGDLRKRVKELEKLVMKSDIPVIEEIVKKDQELYGFTLQERGTGTDKKYWYAGKTIDKKLKWVYIGKDKNKASQKIEQWLLSNGYNLFST